MPEDPSQLWRVVLSTPDATVSRYVRESDRLTIEFALWDGNSRLAVAVGVTHLEDSGTWESDAVVRVPELDAGDKVGYGIQDVEGNITLRFLADRIHL